MIRVKKSLSVGELFDYLARLEREEPVTPEMLERDIKLSEARDYNVMCTVKQKGCLSAQLPDLSQPFATVKTEAGVRSC
jgi:hypothetical protein